MYKIKLVFAIGDLQFAFAALPILLDIASIAGSIVLVYLVFGLFSNINVCVNKISIERANHTGREP